MARNIRCDYADRAYERFCAKRDREAKLKGGCRANGHPLNSKSTSPVKSIDYDASRQLDDAAWFEKFPRAQVRLRELRDEDGHCQAARALLLITVLRSGSRAYVYRWKGAELQ